MRQDGRQYPATLARCVTAWEIPAGKRKVGEYGAALLAASVNKTSSEPIRRPSTATHSAAVNGLRPRQTPGVTGSPPPPNPPAGPNEPPKPYRRPGNTASRLPAAPEDFTRTRSAPGIQRHFLKAARVPAAMLKAAGRLTSSIEDVEELGVSVASPVRLRVAVAAPWSPLRSPGRAPRVAAPSGQL